MDTIKFSSRYTQQAKDFHNIYKEDVYIDCPEKIPQNLKPKHERICRFCKRKAGNTTFRKDAHTLPFALGNRYNISDFECDRCNERFGGYENDLINYLGLGRTISRTAGRKKIPGFVSRNLKASKYSFYGTDSAIKIESPTPSTVFQYNKETNERTITYDKASYMPINVFKSLYKMALCFIDESEIEDYSLGFQFLTTNLLDKINGLMLFGYRLPASYDNLFAMLFKKRDPSINSTTHCFVLFYKDFMLQISLPFNRNDFIHYNNLSHPLMPPIFDGSGDEKWIHSYQIQKDLSSSVIERDDKETITMRFDEEALKNLVAIDLTTSEIVKKEFNPNDIAGIFLTEKGFTIKIEKDGNTP